MAKATTLAQAVRTRVGNTIPVDAVMAAQCFGIEIGYEPALQAKYVVKQSRRLVLPHSFSDERRRLMISQLLGLHLLDANKSTLTCEPFIQNLSEQSALLPTKCRMADRFAMELLMPAKLVTKLSASQTLEQLAAFFGVEARIMNARMLMLKTSLGEPCH